MQTTGSRTVSPGWSRRTRIVVGVAVLVIFGVWFSYLTVEYIYPGALSPPSDARRSEMTAALADQVRQEVGPELESVDVRYGRDGLAPAYFGEFRLRGLPLLFTFSARDDSLRYHGLFGPPDTGAIGGPDRFAALARAFHDDFPAQRTMDYTVVNSPEDLPASLRRYAERPGPTVVVGTGEGDTYRSLGVYSWDAQARAWELVDRGAVPGHGD